MARKEAVDKFALITQQLIEMMEAGTSPWEKPWSTNAFKNAVSGHEYQGINPLILQTQVMACGYESRLFVGFKQAKTLGWKVVGKATWIRCGAVIEVDKKNTDGEIKTELVGFSKFIPVFNLDVIEDTDAEVSKEEVENKHSSNLVKSEPRLTEAEKLIEDQNASVIYGSDSAFYSPSKDEISMPDYNNFSSSGAFYSTIFHELSHWTGHSSRLDRLKQDKFGSESYAFEELVAELSSAFLCNEFGMKAELENHASYLSNWIKILRSDNKAFLKAVSFAYSASNLILSNGGLKKDYVKQEEKTV